jgi:hypothetical protein
MHKWIQLAEKSIIHHPISTKSNRKNYLKKPKNRAFKLLLTNSSLLKQKLLLYCKINYSKFNKIYNLHFLLKNKYFKNFLQCLSDTVAKVKNKYL